MDTYLDHFLLCARNPTLPKDQTAMGQACMSKGGVPVQPYFVLGGFPGKEYREAQAAVMTILGKLAMLCCYFELGFLKYNQIRRFHTKSKLIMELF